MIVRRDFRPEFSCKIGELLTMDDDQKAPLTLFLERIEPKLDKMLSALTTVSHGCVCPVGAEATCGGVMCPRRWPPNMVR